MRDGTAFSNGYPTEFQAKSSRFFRRGRQVKCVNFSIIGGQIDHQFCCGFSQLSTLEFLRSGTETRETENHLLRGWCSKCL